MTHGKSLDVNAALPRVAETLDAIRREYEIDVEGAVAKLHEVLAALDLRRLGVAQRKSQFPECSDHGPRIDR